MRLRIRVTPRASRNAIEGREGVLHVHVTAPASEGRANDAALRVLADALGVAPSALEIASGPRSREKLVSVPDGAAPALRRLLPGLLLLLALTFGCAAPSSVGPPTPSRATTGAAASAGATATATRATVALQEYPVTSGARPHDVAPAQDGGVWYTAQATGELGWLDPGTGRTRQVRLGDRSAPHGVIVGPDGAPWITDGGLNAIARVDPKSFEVRVFRLPGDRPDANLNTATFDRDGVLWFTGQSGIYGKLEFRTPAGAPAITVFDAPRGFGPYGIATTPSGDVYFASLAGSYVGKIDRASGAATVLEPPTRGQGARRVWSDSRGRIWVSEWNAGQLARYDPAARQWKEWRLPGDRPQAYAVFVDDRDAIWLSDWGANALVRFDPDTETFAAFPYPAPNGNVRQLLGRPGEVWAAQSGLDRILVARTR